MSHPLLASSLNAFVYLLGRIIFVLVFVFLLLAAVHSLPHLTVLSLSGCSKITDDGVELIAENLQKLRALDLSWCPRITDAALEYIACDLNMLEELTLDRFVVSLLSLSLECH
jgi:Leucine Rich repeat